MPALFSLIIVLCIAVLATLQGCTRLRSFPGPVPMVSEERLVVSVQGISCELDDIVWRDSRIGLGLEKRLTELLLATGKTRLVAEAPPARKARQTALMLAWATKGKVDFDTLPTTTPAQYTAYARIVSFGLPARQISLGFTHYSRVRSILRIKVCMREQKSGDAYCATGEGYSATSASNVAFHIEGNQLLLERTEAGRAIDEALRNAIAQLFPVVH